MTLAAVHEDHRISEKVIFALAVFLISSFVILSAKTYGRYLMLLLMTAILSISAIQNHGCIHIRMNAYQYFVGAFMAFCFLSALWAVYPGKALQQGLTILNLLICFWILYNHYAKYDSVHLLLLIFMWAGTVVSLYTIYDLGFSAILRTTLEGYRLESLYANINDISGVAASSTVIAFSYLLKRNRAWLIYAANIVLNAIIVAASGSRKSLVIALAGCFLIAMARKHSGNIMKTVLRWAVVILVSILVIRFLSHLPIFSMVWERMEGMIAMLTGQGKADGSAMKRMQMIKCGFDQFLKTPILGIGIGNSFVITKEYFNGIETYLHNNFVELLATGGIVGFLVYYSGHIYLLYSFWKLRRNRTDNITLCIVLFLIMIAMDMGQVSYYSKINYFELMMFFLCVKQQQTLQKREKQEER